VTNRERFLAALRGELADRVPVFPLLVLLAAGRAGMS
jgi:uroporphyrinogen-III decarboxylase